MTSEINNIDGRTFAVASDPLNGLGSIVYKTRRNDKYVLAETRGPLFDTPKLLSSELGPHHEDPILPDGNIALCYNPAIDGQRMMFFLDENEGDGYIYMRTSAEVSIDEINIASWNFPIKIIVRGKGFEAHKKTRLAALFHRDADRRLIFLFCIDQNCHLVKLQGEVSPTGDHITWTSRVSPYICAPRGDLAAVEVGAQICILYRTRDMDLYMARIPNYDHAEVWTNGDAKAWARNYMSVAWQGCSTLIREASKLERESPLALKARTHGGISIEEPAVDAFYVRRHEKNASRLIYCSLRIVAPLSQGDGEVWTQNGEAGTTEAEGQFWDARPDANDLPGQDVRSGSKIGVYVQNEQSSVFFVDSTNRMNSLRRAEIQAVTDGEHRRQRVIAPITVVTDVELYDGSLIAEETGAGAGETGDKAGETEDKADAEDKDREESESETEA